MEKSISARRQRGTRHMIGGLSTKGTSGLTHRYISSRSIGGMKNITGFKRVPKAKHNQLNRFTKSINNGMNSMTNMNGSGYNNTNNSYSSYNSGSNSPSYMSSSNMNKRYTRKSATRLNKGLWDNIKRWLGGDVKPPTPAKRYPNAEMFDPRFSGTSYNPTDLDRRAVQEHLNQFQMKPSRTVRERGFGYDGTVAPDHPSQQWLSRSEVDNINQKIVDRTRKANLRREKSSSRPTGSASRSQSGMYQTDMFNPEYQGFISQAPRKQTTARQPFVVPSYTGPLGKPKINRQWDDLHPALRPAFPDEAGQWLSANPINRLRNRNQMIRDLNARFDMEQVPGYGLPPGLTRDSVREMREGMFGVKKRAVRKSANVSKRANGPSKNKYFK